MKMLKIRAIERYINDKDTKLFILLTLLGVFLLFIPPYDPDFGWHLKHGEYIFNNLDVPRQNLFSYTLPGYKWADSYWLSELIMYVLYSNFGAIGMGLVFSVFVAGSLVFLVKKISSDTRISTPGIFYLILVFLVHGAYLVTVRPLLFSSIFVFFMVYTLLFNEKATKALPLLFLFWANMHADFVLGLFIFAFFIFFKLFEKPFVFKKFLSLCFFWFLSFFATFINPYGYGLHLTLLNELRPTQFSVISEWLPISVSKGSFFVLYVFVLSLIVASIPSLSRMHKLPKWYVWLILLFVVLSFRASYFFRIVILISAWSILDFAGYTFYLISQSFAKDYKAKLLFTSLATFYLIFFTGLFVFGYNIYLSSNVQRWSKAKEYPYDAIEYIKNNKIEGNIFNSYEWGGYLIWQFPEKRTFIDGRMSSWRSDGDPFIKDYVETTRLLCTDGSRFNDLASEYDISIVLAHSKSDYVQCLISNNAWRKVFKDDIAVVLVRN